MTNSMSNQPPAAFPSKIEPGVLSSAIREAYHNRSLATVNDHEVRMSVMTDGFGWHHHPDSDETFIGVDGELVIEFKAGEVILGPGHMLTVAKGVVHRKRPRGARSVNLTFERKDAETIFENPD
jgi:mannose-6-phosphate isomerase-like protein (cupin superfamily)